MFRSNNDACVKPSSFIGMYFIFGVVNGFLPIIWFNFLNLDRNMNTPLFFGWINVGTPHSDLFTV